MSRNRIIAGKAVIIVEAQDMLNKTLGKIKNNLHRFANVASRAGDQAMRGGLLGGIASGIVLRQFVKFDDLMLELQVKLGMFGQLSRRQQGVIDGLERRIRNLGKSTSFTSQEIAQAAIELAKGGLAPTEITNSLQSILDLARGTRASLGDSGKMFVRTMRTFGLASDQAGKIVSQFVRATRAGTLNIEDLEMALRFASGTAATLEQDLAPLLAIFAELSNKGLAGSIAGTSFNTAMANIVKKMEELSSVYSGFQMATSGGRLDLLGTFKNLFEFTKNMPSTQQVQVFQKIFNLRGARAIAGIRDIKKIQMLANEIANVGDEARQAAETMDSRLGGSLRKAMSAVQDLAIEFGDATSKHLKPMIDAVRTLTNMFSELVKMNPTLASMVILSPGILLASGVALMGIAKAARIAASAVGLLQTGVKGIGGFGAKLASRQLGAVAAGAKNAKGVKMGTLAGISKFAGDGKQQIAAARQQIKSRKELLRIAKMEALLDKGPKNAAYYRQMGHLTKQANVATKLGRVAKARSISLIGSQLGLAAKGIWTFVKGLAVSARMLARFAFSWTGVWTALEILVITNWNQIGNGISGAMKALSNIGTLAKGPIQLMVQGFKSLSQGDGAGLQGIIQGAKNLLSIIGTQLVAAWYRFLDGVQAVAKFFMNIFTVVSSIVDSVMRVGSMLGQGLGGLKELAMGNLFDGSGGFVGAMQQLGTELAVLVVKLFAWIEKLVSSLSATYQKFLIDFERIIGKVTAIFRPFGNAVTDEDAAAMKKSIDQRTASQHHFAEKSAANAEAKIRSRAFRQEFKARAEAARKASQRTSDQSRGGAMALMRHTQQMLARQAMQARIQQQKQAQAQARAQMEANRRGGTAGSMTRAVEETKRIMRSVIGSAAATRGNVTQRSMDIERKQLAEQRRTNTLLERQLNNGGGLLQ